MHHVRSYPYESFCRKEIVDTLNRHNIGLDSRYHESSRRVFKKIDYFKDFEDAADMLRACNWEALGQGSYEASEIEIDCLLHIQNPGRFVLDSQIGGFYHIRPKKFKVKQAVHNYQKKRISSSSVDPQSNTYVMIEGTSGKTTDDLVKLKAAQMERSLAFLLCKKRNEVGNVDVKITELVSYVGIACPKNISNQVTGLLTTLTELPLLTELFKIGRFIGFTINFDLGKFIGKQFEVLNSSINTFSSFRDETEAKLQIITSELQKLTLFTEQASKDRKDMMEKIDLLLKKPLE
jgi:hypothetical protein